MARASDNPFPSIRVTETTAPASPASGDQRLYIDPADHKLKRKDSSGTVTTIEGGGGGTGDTSWTTATLLNSWVTFGAPYGTPGFMKDSAGVVHLRGLVKNGSSAGATVFTLPSGYRPSAQILPPASANSAFNAILIDTSGNVSFANSFTTSTYGSLDGVSFSTL